MTEQSKRPTSPTMKPKNKGRSKRQRPPAANDNKPEYGHDMAKQMREAVDNIADDIGDSEMLVADGFDAAIIGITEGLEPKVVYDWQECVNILIMRDGMSEEDALEHMSFNVTGSYVGPRTPLFIKLLD